MILEPPATYGDAVVLWSCHDALEGDVVAMREIRKGQYPHSHGRGTATDQFDISPIPFRGEPATPSL